MFKQKSDLATAKLEPADAVQQARTRARQRLIGAIVLLAIGIIGFPLVFETQPRPIPVDIPIEIPRREGLPPLTMPPARPNPATTQPLPSEGTASVASAPPAPTPAASAATKPALRGSARASEPLVSESSAQAGREIAPPRAAAAPVAATSASTEVRGTGEGERARALLEGRPVAAAEDQRFVVQVGAFADAEAARGTRKQVERLGLKTYTQIAQTPAGNRIRVRVGPFATRAEAETALAKAKAAGLAAVLLTL